MALPIVMLGAAAAAAGWAVLKRQRAEPRHLESPLGDPSDPERWEAHLYAAVRGEDWPRAVRFHRRIAAFNRGDARIRHLLDAARLCEERLGDAEGAIACYEDVLLVNSEDAEALSGLTFLRG